MNQFTSSGGLPSWAQGSHPVLGKLNVVEAEIVSVARLWLASRSLYCLIHTIARSTASLTTKYFYSCFQFSESLVGLQRCWIILQTTLRFVTPCAIRGLACHFQFSRRRISTKSFRWWWSFWLATFRKFMLLTIITRLFRVFVFYYYYDYYIVLDSNVGDQDLVPSTPGWKNASIHGRFGMKVRLSD